MNNAFISILAAFLFFSFPTFAMPMHRITIVNHFEQALQFMISVNADLLPDLSQTFSLEPQTSVQTRVVDLSKEAYILTEDAGNHLGFWGVEIAHNHLQFHGYTSKGIAFSFNEKSIIFCNPEEYQSNGACVL